MRLLSLPLLFSISLVVLGGCQTLQNSYGNGAVVEKDAKELLDAQEGKMKSDEELEYSPIEQHMKARQDVDPTKINRKNKFSKTVDDYEVVDKENIRVVRVDKDVSTIDREMKAKGLKVEADSLSEKGEAKSYIESVLAKYGISGETPKETISVSRSTVQSVRIGQHPGKTRIVLDVSGKTNFQTQFENGNKVLVVTLPDAVWGTDATAKVSGASLVSGYDTKKKKQSSVFKVFLAEPGRLAYQKAIKPSGARGHRIVFDVVSR